MRARRQRSPCIEGHGTMQILLVYVGGLLKFNNDHAVLLEIRHLRRYAKNALRNLVGIRMQHPLNQQNLPKFFVSWLVAQLYQQVQTMFCCYNRITISGPTKYAKICCNFNGLTVIPTKRRCSDGSRCGLPAGFRGQNYAGYIKRLLTCFNFLQTSLIYSIINQFQAFDISALIAGGNKCQKILRPEQASSLKDI